MQFKHYILFCAFFALMACNTDDDSPENGDNISEFQGEIDVLKSFGGSAQDDFLSVVESQDLGIVAFGFTQSNDGDITDKTTTDSDYWLVKFDRNLNLIWQKTFGGSSDDRGQSLISTTDGGFAVTGFTRSNDGDISTNYGFQDFWVVKLDANGSIEWETSIGFAGNDRGYDIIQTQDGGYFVTGFLDVTASNGEGNDDFNSEGRPMQSFSAKHGVGEFWGIKLDAQGEMQWRRYFGGTNNDRSRAVIQTADGGFLQTGHSESDDFDITNPKGSYDVWVVKTSAEGDLLWEKNFGGSSIEIAYDLVPTSDGNFILVGDTRSSDQDISNPKGNADVWVIKFDGEGNMIWEKSFGGSDFDSAQSIEILNNGEFLITGNSKSIDNDLNQNYGQNDIWNFIISTNGELQWQLNIGGDGLDFGNDSVQLQDGSIIVVGSSESDTGDIEMNKGDKDAVIFKLK
ncbi:hypothetical protein [Psychroflexus aestuariivivens]|uniref:hypothetical protein n=1 Tax=Psychroflexus aestuariivivens TaxID=1795040 RepID=UPI000FDC7B04|nr:hypothetical protein [Psychroflexus aestuariivivens]